LCKENPDCRQALGKENQESETAEHLFLRCVFAQEVWLLVAEWTEDEVLVPGCYHYWIRGLRQEQDPLGEGPFPLAETFTESTLGESHTLTPHR
jgi:hypothetical protein